MKINLTAVVLLGILGLVAYKLVAGGQPLIGSGASSPSANPTGGSTPSAQSGGQDLFQTILGTATAVMNTITTIAQSSPKTT